MLIRMTSSQPLPERELNGGSREARCRTWWRSSIGHALRYLDHYMVCVDFDSYYAAQRAIDARWQVVPAWTRASILNVARMAWFSSDRTIREYAQDIWNVPVDPAVSVETQAHRFAAAFLMPSEDIYSDLPDRADWPTLFALKQEWEVSIAALLRRSRDLGKMSTSSYQSAMKLSSARGWRRTEPVPLGLPEQPHLLETLMSSTATKSADTLLPHAILDELVLATVG